MSFRFQRTFGRAPVFIPLVDNNPLRHVRRPYVTWALIAATCLSYLITWIPGVAPDERVLATSFGMIPSILEGYHALAPNFDIVPGPLTLLTYPFIHADLLHLLGNMLFLRAFGDNVEDAFGHVRFAIFYLLAGAFAGLIHTVAHPMSDAPLIGASGAVAAVVAAYVTLHPKVQLWVLAFGRVPLRLPAWSAIGLWVVFQIYNMWVQPDGDVAWFAHVGGLAFGFALVVVFRRPGVPLFDREVGLIIEDRSTRDESRDFSTDR
jgi:membrane associated rhomboid family serine protease